MLFGAAYHKAMASMKEAIAGPFLWQTTQMAQ
jgi:hypothetical protein